MFSYLILVLSISLVLGNEFERSDNEFQAVEEKHFEERFVREKSRELLQSLVQKLRDAYDKGADALNKVINDDDVRRILDSLDSLNRRAAEALINKFKRLRELVDNVTRPNGEKSKRDFKEDSIVLLKKLTQILVKSYRKGGEYLNKAINDPDVQTILQHLGPLSRKVANLIIDGFRDLVDKIDELTKPETVEKRSILELPNTLLKKLIARLLEASKKGAESVRAVLNDPDVITIRKSLDSVSRRFLDAFIDKLNELVNEIKGKKSVQEKRAFQETYVDLLKKLTQICIKSYRKGTEYFQKTINDPDVQAILQHLGPLSRKAADKIIEGFKELVDKLDQLTKEQSAVEKRDFQESSYRLLQKLFRLLEVAYAKGSKALDAALADPDFKAILNSLDSLTRRIADAAIENFKKLVIAIDKATNDEKISKEKRSLFERPSVKLKRLIQRLLAASRQGAEFFEKTMKDPDVVAIIESFDSLTRRLINELVESLRQVVNRIDEATKP